MNDDVKVSVIIPVYCTEKWIGKCSRSLFSQTMQEGLEYIFVDDCSPDKSIEVMQRVLKEYPHRRNQVRVIRHEQNHGVAAARTTGMKAATGEYMIHCDPDDWIEAEMYEQMYLAAINNNADIVTCNYYTESINGQQKCLANYFSSFPRECIEHLYEYSFFPSLCNSLISTKLIHEKEIYPFPNINTGEDLNVIFRVYHYGNKMFHNPECFYHYNRHDGSLSLNKEYRGLFERNIYPNINQLADWSAQNGEYDITINYLKFQKKMFLLAGDKPQLKIWWHAWPESNKDISKFTSYSKRTRIIFKVCSASYLFLLLYFKIFRKLVS